MRKIFTILAATMCSFASFAQDIQLETKDGQIIANGATVTIKGEMIDKEGYMGEFDSHLYVRNLTDKKQGVYAQMKAIKGYPQICGLSSCYPTTEMNPIATTGLGVIGVGEPTNLQIHTQYFSIMYPNYMTEIVTCTIELSLWTKDKPDEKITATITFTNDEAVLGIEELKETSAKVYAKDNVLYCQFADAANRQLQVFNIAGNLCKDIRLTSESESLPLEGMAKGVYIYSIMEKGKKAESGKFLVK